MSYDTVIGVADEAAAIKADYEAMRSGLDNLIRTLTEQWEGAAKKEFLTAYNKLKPKQAAVCKTLERYSASVSKVCTQERSTETKTSQEFKSF